MSISNNTGHDKIYCYPGTNILKNKYNIRDQKRFQQMERDFTTVRASELEVHPIQNPTFDVQYLKQIHYRLFQDIYDWAGKFRTVDIAKSNLFCRVPFMEEQLNYVFRQLKAENNLKGIQDREQLGSRLGYYMAEINAVHPFREGNGRTQRIFINELAKQNGYMIQYDQIPKDQLLDAAIESFTCNYTKMQKLITDALIPIITKEEEDFKEAVQTLETLENPFIKGGVI